MGSELMVTDADREAVHAMIREEWPLAAKMSLRNPSSLYAIFARHRQAALIEGVRLGIEAAAPAMQAVQCPFDDHATAHAYERGMLDALAAIRALSPEAIAARAVEKQG